uniref:RE1-silencing transcription factor n=1 Tax=Cacopsylla melanoneura TaxID=428564 RepID=A0A8D8V6Q7_9HEMI
MAAPSMVHGKGDSLVIRSVVDGEDLYGSGMRKRIEESLIEQNVIQDTAEETDLPQCKIKRNYACNTCDYFTQNPRTYLHHLRDVHFEKIKIYECSSCLYASKHSQKLQRHIHMVHVMGAGKKRQSNKPKTNKVLAPVMQQPLPLLPVQVISTPTLPPNFGESNVSNTDSDENPMMEDDLRISSPVNQDDGVEKQFRCSMCMFVSHNANLVSRHERVVHLKKKLFRCVKCNYVTHMKARFTKHVKYHSMPMIKCELCDFRTPYKWNLDRHWKNHTGEGAFKCSLCNFTADIKQSLTVHEMNHHVPSAGQASIRRRNRVGGSDLFQDEEDAAHDMDEEMIRLEREDQNSSDIQNESEDQHYSDMRCEAGDNSDSDSGSVSQHHHYNPDFDSNSNEALNLQNGFLKLNQCRACSFKSAWESELKHHENTAHGLTDSQSQAGGLPDPQASDGHPEVHSDSHEFQEKKKPARPIPNLIPIQAGASKVGPTSPGPESGRKEGTMSDKDLNEFYAKSCPNSALKDFASVIGGHDVFNNTPTDLSLNDADKTNDSNSNSSIEENKKDPELFKKKNASFFDKLKERIMTATISNEPGNNNLHCKSCPHVAKCLSEYILHQKLHATLDSASSVPSPSSVATSSSTGSPIHNGGSASTRCQFCRQRCKSSADLVVHLQMCSRALANGEESQSSNSETGQFRYQQDKENDGEKETREEVEDLRTTSRRVFIWNNLPCETTITEDPPPSNEDPPLHSSHSSPSRASNSTEDQGWRSKSPSESSLLGFETTPGYGSVTSKTKSGSHGHINPDPLPLDPNGGPGRGELTLKKVYKCPHCAFWASTASRFHVHIVGHLNKKPFECSLCAYRSNWRWDITKHIRLKTIRDPAHEAAKVLMTDETGRRNYTKYNKYLTLMKVHEPNAESSGSGKRSNQHQTRVIPTSLVPHARPAYPGGFPASALALAMSGENPFKRPAPSRSPPHEEEPSAKMMRSGGGANNNNNEGGGSKKTMWKCKKCLFRDGDRGVVLAHVKEHYRVAALTRMSETAGCDDIADISEVKNMTISKLHEEAAEHNNNIISREESAAKLVSNENEDQEFVLYCEMCEFKTASNSDYESHLRIHYARDVSSNVSYRCYKCTFSSLSKSTLMEHLQSHGIQGDVDMSYYSALNASRSFPKPPVITSEGRYLSYM